MNETGMLRWGMPRHFPCTSSLSLDNSQFHPTQHFSLLLNQVVGIKPLLLPTSDGDNNKCSGKKVYVAELFHGPSLAFKDLGMQARCVVQPCVLGEGNGAAVSVVWGRS